MSNQAVSKALGIGETRVRIERARRGIPNPAGTFPPIVWTHEMLELLGKLPDRKLARRFGVGFNSVVEKRRELGLKPPKGDPVAWTPERDALLGRDSDLYLARCWGMTADQVRNR